MEPPLGRRLYLGQRAIADALGTRFTEQGASVWNWVLLKEASRGEGASQRELARRMRIEPPTLVRHLDRLEAEGFVERRPDPNDRRAVRVMVTPRGRRRFAQLNKAADLVDQELRSILTEREAEMLGDVLMRIHNHFATASNREERPGVRHT